MQIYNSENLKNNLIKKGIKVDKSDIELFNKSDYYQVINANKMLFVKDIEDIEMVLSNIDKGINLKTYQNIFDIKEYKDLDDFKNKVLDFLSIKYAIEDKDINVRIDELKRIKYTHHIYDERSNFNDFYRIFEFEHDLRILLLKYVLKIENSLKQVFIKTLNNFDNMEDNFLTNIENYNTSIENYSNSIRTLKEILNLYDSSKSKAITRKVEQNISIPYWILINEMTFGNVLKCINNLKSCYSNKIYQNLINEFTNSKLSFDNKKDLKDIKVFISILDYIGSFRNALAHNHSIYKFNIKDSSLNNFKDFSYSIPSISKADLNKINNKNEDERNLIKECQRKINNNMKKSFQVFFSKDSFNQNMNYSDFSLSYMIYLIYKISIKLDSKCKLKNELIDLFYDYNILYTNNKLNPLSNEFIPKKYNKHFRFDSSYTYFTGITINFLTSL